MSERRLVDSTTLFIKMKGEQGGMGAREKGRMVISIRTSNGIGSVTLGIFTGSYCQTSRQTSVRIVLMEILSC